MEKRKDSPRSEKWFVCSGHRWVTKGNGAGESCLTEPAPRRGGGGSDIKHAHDHLGNKQWNSVLLERTEEP